MGAARLRPRGAHHQPSRAAVARVHLRLPPRERGRLRRAGAADLRGSAGRQGEPVERRRPQLDVVQLGAAWSGRRPPGCSSQQGGDRLGLSPQRHLLRRGASLSLALPAHERAPRPSPRSAGRQDAAAKAGCSRGHALRRRAGPQLRTPLVMVLFIGTFGLNFPIFISTMAVQRLPRRRRRQFGLLSSMMAIGSVTAALLVAQARREPTHRRSLRGRRLVFGVGCALAAMMPTYLLLRRDPDPGGRVGAELHHLDQRASCRCRATPSMRGRVVVAIFLAIALGSTPVGAPLVGWVADRFGPRWALGVAAAAAGSSRRSSAVRYLVTYRHLRVRRRRPEASHFDPRRRAAGRPWSTNPPNAAPQMTARPGCVPIYRKI